MRLSLMNYIINIQYKNIVFFYINIYKKIEILIIKYILYTPTTNTFIKNGSN